MRDGRDSRGFAEFASARSPALFRYAYLLAGDRGLAEDLLQEALTKTYVAWRRVRSDNPESYVRRVIVTTAISWWKRKAWTAERPHGRIPENQLSPHDDEVAVRQWLWEELLRLPPRQRAAIVLRYYEDKTEAQTADILGCSLGTVKSQVHAGLRRLRERVGTDVAPQIGEVAVAE